MMRDIKEYGAKDILGYEGEYAITCGGCIWSYKSEKFLKTRFNRDGYEVVNLSKNGILKTFSIHRLVAQAFIPNPNNYSQVNHIDGDKENNNIWNLEWCSAKQNNIHAIETGLRKSKSCIRRIHCIETGFVYDNVAQAARATKTPSTSIWNCLKGKQKTANMFHWEYVD